MQVLQKLCPHGVVTKSVNTSRQMEHRNWSSVSRQLAADMSTLWGREEGKYETVITFILILFKWISFIHLFIHCTVRSWTMLRVKQSSDEQFSGHISIRSPKVTKYVTTWFMFVLLKSHVSQSDWPSLSKSFRVRESVWTERRKRRSRERGRWYADDESRESDTVSVQTRRWKLLLWTAGNSDCLSPAMDLS